MASVAMFDCAGLARTESVDGMLSTAATVAAIMACFVNVDIEVSIDLHASEQKSSEPLASPSQLKIARLPAGTIKFMFTKIKSSLHKYLYMHNEAMACAGAACGSARNAER